MSGNAQRTILCALALAACGNPPPPPPAPAPREATQVAASFGRTWDAVIAHFAANSIPINTIDRSSGLIVTAPLYVAPNDGKKWGWCGWTTDEYNEWAAVPPAAASYNVLVRGDSARATVRVTARWTAPEHGECVSKDVFEPTLEQALKARAESGRP